MKMFEVAVSVSEHREGNVRVISAPIHKYVVIAESPGLATRMVEDDLGPLNYAIITFSCTGKGDVAGTTKPRISRADHLRAMQPLRVE